MGLLSRLKRFLLSDEEWRRLQYYPMYVDEVRPLKVQTVADTIESWQRQVKVLEEHPLSQARVINTKILNQITEILQSISEKLEELKKLDELLQLLKEEERPRRVFRPRSAVEYALTNVGHVTYKDKEVIELLESSGEEGMTSEEVGAALNLARSTVCYRLNRLYSMGLVDKKMVGRKIVFVIKKGGGSKPNLTKFFYEGPKEEKGPEEDNKEEKLDI